MRVRFSAVLLCLLYLVPLGAQEAQPSSAQVDELKALVFVLQTKLASVEKELGEEKSRRAALEEAELLRAREKLEPNVKRKLGLPVPEASNSQDKAAPTEKAPPKP